MHLLITRPKEEADALQAKLAARGVGSTVMPMLEIDLIPPVALDLDGVQALIATSRNGLKALALSPSVGKAVGLPIYVVGHGTATLAKDIGFQRVTIGPGSARELVPVIVGQGARGGGRLVQLAGDKLAFDLTGALAADGFMAEVVTVYCSRPARQFSGEALTGLRSGTIDTVLLTSPLAARTFVMLATETQLSAQCQGLVYVCLSQEIARSVAPLKPGFVHVASAPNTDATMNLIERLALSEAQDRAPTK